MSEKRLPAVTENEFKGMWANSRAVAPLGFHLLAQNFFVKGNTVVPRDGMVSLGDPSGAGDDVQGCVEFVELDGTQHWLVFSGGDMHEYDFVGGSWTTTDLSSEGVTMSSATRLSFANSRGRLVVTDGVNVPWLLEGTTGAWTFTALSNAPIASGCDIYYDKVFFWGIGGEENEFEWSDEGDPANGYEANDQVWEFAQRDAGRIISMKPMNEVMNIFKEDSSSMLMGAVDEDFRTNAVREGLSETEGCVGQRAAVVFDGDVYFLSQNGPRVSLQGQRMVKADEIEGGDIVEDFWDTVDTGEWQNSVAVIDKKNRLVIWLVPVDSAKLNQALVYSPETGAFTTFKWNSSFDFNAACPVEDANGDEWVLFGDKDGTVYKYGDRSFSDAGTAIPYVLRSRYYGRSSPSVVKRLAEVQLLFNLETDLEGEMRPHALGKSEQQARGFGVRDETGRFRYRRGFNFVDYAPGWEVSLERDGQGFSVESAVTILTALGIYGDM